MHIATGNRSSLGPQNSTLHPRYCDKTRAGEAYRPFSARGRALPPPHDISGLIAWARREEWRDALATLIERHSAKACAGAGIAPEDIGDTLGEYAAANLFGAAFEDLLATDLPDGRNIADDYLRRRGWRESVSTREYIAGLRRSVISLYEVSGLVPGESMLLRDLVRGGEPVRVWEKSGSQGLRPWDRIATRGERDHTCKDGAGGHGLNVLQLLSQLSLLLVLPSSHSSKTGTGRLTVVAGMFSSNPPAHMLVARAAAAPGVPS